MSEAKAKGRPARRRPDLDTVYTINTDGSRNFLHPADVKGRWQRRKHFVFAILIAVYALMPWIQFKGRPLVHIDLPGRSAQLFGTTFTNQDFFLVFFLVTGTGFALIVLTSLWGRVWCGYACPQTVFMEGVFRRIERWIEGPRNRRIRRNLGPWGFDKIWRKLFKHAAFLLLSYAIAHIFLAYFIPARELLAAIGKSPAAHKSAFFWSMFWTGILYFDYSWFREQTCLIICPYGRLQSTLIDDDTVIIGYDGERGEPRSKGVDQGGDCIDCYRCVEVCPTGIDIRNGLQLECIGCANCIDACDEIMDRIDKPRGLVRYDSQRSLDTGRQRFWRPRVWVYAILGLLGLLAFGFKAAERAPLQVNVLRSRGLPFTLTEGELRNLYTLHIQNKTPEARVYRIVPGEAPPELAAKLQFIIPQSRVEIDGLSDQQVPLFATLQREAYQSPFDLNFSVTDSLADYRHTVKMRFQGP